MSMTLPTMSLNSPMASTWSEAASSLSDHESLLDAPKKADFAARAEAFLRDVDAKLVKELRAGVRPESPSSRASALVHSRENELRAELGRSKLYARELEQRCSESWRALQESRKECDRARATCTHLTRNLAEVTRECERLQGECVLSERRKSDLQRELQRSDFERNRLTDAVAEHQAAIIGQREALARSHAQFEMERVHCRKQLEDTNADMERLREQRRAMEVKLRTFEQSHGSCVTTQTRRLAELEVAVDKVSKQFETTKLELNVQQGGTHYLKSRIHSLEQELTVLEVSRRELHNTIQELRGNIRVCCRVRPAHENGAVALQSLAPNRLGLTVGGECTNFGFDLVFGQTVSQADVFGQVDGLVQSALDGYKVCIFAYGQTGSGKTHTMIGNNDAGSRGLIPRSLTKILQSSEAMRAKGWSWSLQATFMEIYNETLRDLLRGNGDAAGGPAGHVITHHEAWGTVVTNMSSVEVNSLDQVGILMDRAAASRSVSATDMNALSSRSHSVFALYLKGTNRDLGQELHGALHLVDLAGSERLAKSGSSGERLKETQNINRSLSSLVDVFSAKAEGRTHIPFRNSKLTHLMEPCLSGQGKTLMLVHVSPEQSNAHETLCALRFAKQVSQCDTGGKPKRNVKVVGTAVPTKAMSPRYEEPLARSPRRSVACTSGGSRSASATRSSSVTRGAGRSLG
eukprot:TRINITY_DN6019_c0_g2_i1.p1 TRINITY_DN6019_c0_g2~~TRINITY_DN6019_c0_g2_i1.p1  ORF type:complete len:691 (+),score=88.84 TRINITY_DN6019_c0_g2_i1:72-2144(+)